MGAPEPSLRTWLRRRPSPAAVRVRMSDGEERNITMPAAQRNRWQTVETAVRLSGAEVVECLDSKGDVIRAMPLEDAADSDDKMGSLRDELKEERASREKTISAERRDLALFAREYGGQLNEAFERGAAAASTSQENLVNLVEVLTRHLAMAITSLHNVSVNLANVVQGAGGDEGSSDTTKLLGTVLSLAAARGMGAPPVETPNGAKGKK